MGVAYVDGRTVGHGRHRRLAASCGPEQMARTAEGAWLTKTDGWAGTSKAVQTDGQADGLADGPNRAKILHSAILAHSK